MSRLLSPFRLHLATFPTAVFFAVAPAPATSSSVPNFLPLIEVTVARLNVARDVALVKWDSHSAIEDPQREKEVLSSAAKEALESGIDEPEFTRMYSDQIEANKLVQYLLHAQWRRNGGAPNEPRSDLKQDIRPRLDRLQQDFLRTLVLTKKLRAEPGCNENLARETHQYVVSRRLDSLHEIALDRALARVCQVPKEKHTV